MPVTARAKRNEAAAFGAQSALMCLLTDFIDIYEGIKHQVDYKAGSSGHTHASAGASVSSGKKGWFSRIFGHEHGGEGLHVTVGEVLGDFAAPPALWLSERFFSRQIAWATEKLGNVLDPLYHVAGTAYLWRWSRQHGLSTSDDAFKERLEQWKQYQKSNLVKAGIVVGSSVAANIAVQKAMGNRLPVMEIFKGKMKGVYKTGILLLSTRLVFPKQTRAIDRWVGDSVVGPALDKIEHLRGGMEHGGAEEETQVGEISVMPPFAPQGRFTERYRRAEPIARGNGVELS